MSFIYRVTFASSLILALTVPAFAGVIISSPLNGISVSSPFTLSANAVTCGSGNVVSMGYSFDSSSDTTVFKNTQSIDASISASSGTHVLHVKAWAPGVSCVEDVTVTISASAATSASASASSSASIPSDADTVSDLQVLKSWGFEHDAGGPGTSTGYIDLITSPSLYGTTRRFVTAFTNDGDERYSTTFSDNTSAENFFYDGWVYLTSSSKMLANLEFDINQTMPNGQTVLTGVQCDGWNGYWAYTVNKGSASSPKPAWVGAAGTSCNPQKWSINKWHHVQFYVSRDSSGDLTYHSIWLDGVKSDINKTVYGAASLGWGPAVNTQFQVDGYGSSGHVTAYLDQLNISMW